jgi:hypothetical protein
MDEAQTILQVQTGQNAYRIVEVGMPDFGMESARPDIEPWEPPSAEQIRTEMRAKRAAAYVLETDPMLGPLARGEITLEAYTAAVDAIRARYPYPE